MRLDDRAMTILTGLVLAIVVGTIAQQSPRILDMFSKKPIAELADDYFLVRSGITQNLDLTGNDRIANIKGDLVLVERPRCGTVAFSGRLASFQADGDCDGNVVFRYCVDGVIDCAPATVALNVRASRDDVRVVSAEPTTPVAPTTSTVGLRDIQPASAPNQEVLQNAVQAASTTGDQTVSVLVASVDQPTPAPQPRPATNRLDPNRLNPNRIAEVALIARSLHTRRDVQFRPRRLELEVAALGGQTSSPSDIARLLGRQAPSVAIDKGAAAPLPNSGLQPLTSSAGQSRAQMGACVISLGLKLAEMADVWVELASNCNKGEAVKIAHEGVGFLVSLDANGFAKMRLPALATRANFVAYFPGHETPVSGQITVPDLLDMTRSLVTLETQSMLDLSAREYDQQTGRERVVTLRQNGDATNPDQGVMQAYAGVSGRRHFVYSRAAALDNVTRITKLQLVGERAEACDMTTPITTHLAEPAYQPGETVHYTLPTCQGQGRYESHLRDIRIAPRDA